MRELEQWMPDGNDDDVDLDLGGSSNGWSAHEMFAKNKEFGVETSYDPNMSGYTTQLTRTKENSAEYKERERKAAQIAAEIEGNTHSIAAVELENGDEEEAFSAVARDKSSPGAGDKDKYVPPGRRDQGPGRGGRGGAQRGARTTPPGNEDYRGGNRYDRSYSGGRGGYNNERGDRYERGGGGYNNDYNRDRGDRFNRQDNHRPGDRSGYKKEDKKSSPLPEHDKQQQADRRKSGESLQVAGAGAGPQRSPGGDQDQGQQRLGAKKSREQQSSELKEFQDNFQLAGSKSPTSTTPRVSVKQGSQGGTPLPSPQPPGQDTSGAPPPDLAPATPSAGDQGSPAPSTGSLSDSVKKSTLNPNAKEFSLNPTAKEFTPRAPTSSRVNPTPPRPQTPNTPNSMTAMAAGIPQVGGHHNRARIRDYNNYLQAFSQAGAYIVHNPQLGMTHVNVGNNGMFVGPGPGQHPGHMLGGAGAGQPLTMAAPSQQLQPGPGQPPYVQNTRPGPGPGEQAALALQGAVVTCSYLQATREAARGARRRAQEARGGPSCPARCRCRM